MNKEQDIFEGGSPRAIHVNGSEILRKKTADITPDYPNLEKLLKDMFATMMEADGIGLAAPQIGLPISVFAIDLEGYETDEDDPLQNNNLDLGRVVFINPQITGTSQQTCAFKEGCLSVPGINENVMRPETITIEYLDHNFEPQTKEFSGLWSRVIQHEYDHLQGVLFVDSIAPIRKQLIRSKLQAMSKGKYKASYRTK